MSVLPAIEPPQSSMAKARRTVVVRMTVPVDNLGVVIAVIRAHGFGMSARDAGNGFVAGRFCFVPKLRTKHSSRVSAVVRG
jgi:hypothetical protein